MFIKFLIVGIAFTIGDVLMKIWSNQNYSFASTGLLTFLTALFIYGAGFVYYGLQLKTNNFGVATLLPIVINILLVLLLTVFYYHEPLSSKQWIGAFLGIAAVILLH